ncbi:MAG: polysaccharide deacetylase [Magnetococcales bacterium]|nr:polysaccharide deacetylase [Magnetococcales bacterium]HIJ85843.1 polysaccharide deacetylase family protein [Magnetococcales bacterium]
MIGMLLSSVETRLANSYLFDYIVNNSFCVFLYHDVTDNASRFCEAHKLSVPTAQFAEQVQIIGRYFKFITPKDVFQRSVPLQSALITFDDGLAGCFENGLHILDQRNTPSIVFMNMEPLDGPVFWSGMVDYLLQEDELFQKASIESRQHSSQTTSTMNCDSILDCHPAQLDHYLQRRDREDVFAKAREYYGPFATREHLAEAEKSKFSFIGNHLFNHFNAAILSDSQLTDAYLQNNQALSTYRNHLNMFSYPFGQPDSCYNKRTHRTLRSLGAEILFSALPAINFTRNDVFYYRIAMNDAITSDEDFRYLLIDSFLRFRYRILKNRFIWAKKEASNFISGRSKHPY